MWWTAFKKKFEAWWEKNVVMDDPHDQERRSPMSYEQRERLGK